MNQQVNKGPEVMAPAGESQEVSLYDLRLLETLEEEPELRQMDLAIRLGVATGTVNWHLKHLAAKGYVKVRKIGRWRWRYLLTPQGFAAKARLTKAYIQRSMQLYRQTRQRAQGLLQEVQRAGYDRVRIVGDAGNDLVDVCRLTCLERGIKIIEPGRDGEDEQPTLHVDGQELSLAWPGKSGIVS